MTPANSAPATTSIRFTSIEPLEPHADKVREIADRHGFEAKFTSRTTLNAPFCGVDYHIQEVCLTPYGLADPAINTRELCLNEFASFEQSQLADGYFEVISASCT